MSYETVIYEKKDRIAYVTLNRPEQMNGFNELMIEELNKIWRDFEKDDDLGVAIVTGAGDKAMTAGRDLGELTGEVGPAKWWLQAQQRGTGTIPTPLACGVRKPTIAAVNGYCIAMGLFFVTDCDIVICSENAAFWDNHVGIGLQNLLMPLVGLYIPWGVAMRMALMGPKERMSAQRAYEVGLVSQVVPLSELIPTATKIAEAILENAPLAVKLTKESMWKSMGMPRGAAYEISEGYWWKNAASEDTKEGMQALSEKRKPQWKAR